VEIMLEKNALRTDIEAVAREYCIPCTTGRGFTSLPPRHDLAQRYRRSGKSGLVLLMLTDFDPDGDEIAASFARSLRDDFNIATIKAIKVMLTAEDVATHDLPSDMDAKESSPNYQKFLARYGSTKVVELDACPVTLLQTKLREAIESVIDIDEFNAQLKLEQEDAAHIEAHRQVVFDAINGTNRPESGGAQ
jgi:5S rRNA maturation endonuclease (ribonuclease M5)